MIANNEFIYLDTMQYIIFINVIFIKKLILDRLELVYGKKTIEMLNNLSGIWLRQPN